MRETGFSEITKERMLYKGEDPWYVEIALTGKCNFNCSYCNRFKCEVDKKELFSYFDTFNNCRHIQLTGGEPTLHPNFDEIVSVCKNKAMRVGLSTNGTAGINRYLELGVDMFSISLDDYDQDILLKRGYKKPQLVIDTIKELSKTTYVNVGLVIDSLNINRIEDIINFILSLGVDDIKLSTSTKDELIPKFNNDYRGYPILDYRVRNFKDGYQMRGWPGDRCKIAENDITIVGNKHYPCLIYFREGGNEIGLIDEDIKKQRSLWVKTHKSKEDPICRKYCMDFKCEFNGGNYR